MNHHQTRHRERKVENDKFAVPPRYYRMSPQEIIERQERKIRQKEEEAEYLHRELDMLYDALFKVHEDRLRLRCIRVH